MCTLFCLQDNATTFAAWLGVHAVACLFILLFDRCLPISLVTQTAVACATDQSCACVLLSTGKGGASPAMFAKG